MAHTNPHPVYLTDKNNRPKRKGKVSAWDKGKELDNKSLRWKDGQTIEKPIQSYRLWYHYLALALELERQGISLIRKYQLEKLDKPILDKYGHEVSSRRVPVLYEIKVDRDKYKDWDLDQIPTTTFDNWWKTHRELFLLHPVKIMEDKKDWISSSHVKHFQIDTRHRISDLSSEIDKILKGIIEDESKKEIPYQFTGNIKVDSYQDRYNALILRITDDKRKDSEILDDEQYFRKELDSSISGSSMRDLLNPAKETLLSVCQGYFPKIP